MKNKEALMSAANARMKQAKKHSTEIYKTLKRMEADGVEGSDMTDLRMRATYLIQCVHEFNAYWNAYSTD